MYGYCEGDPINYTDPTGMWGEEIHKALTKSAYNKVLGKSLSKKERKRLKNIGLKRLQKNCTFPDKQRGTNPDIKMVHTMDMVIMIKLCQGIKWCK